MILFMHGLLSNHIINTKFKSISYKNKICKTVYYHKLSYDEVSKIYDELIIKYKPDLIVGHSMGGYWSIVKSKEHNIPCLAMNPFIRPKRLNFFPDYKNLTDKDFTDKVTLYLEMGDRLLNMKSLHEMAKKNNINHMVQDGGSHFIKHTNNINKMIDKFI